MIIFLCEYLGLKADASKYLLCMRVCMQVDVFCMYEYKLFCLETKTIVTRRITITQLNFY